MFRRTIASALITAAAVAAALAYKALLESKEEPEKEENDDDEIRFIRISDDDEPKAKEPEMPKEVQEICAVYPYLNADFVKEELAKSAGLNAEYPEDTLVTVTHNAAFPEESGAKTFTEIMTDNGYICESDAPLLVSASRRFFTEEGAILSDVLNVANQANALGGTYQEYFIIK